MPVKRFKGAKAKADKLFSEIIRSQGYCEANGVEKPCSNQLQTAHICSRRYSSTRTDLRNAFCLCFNHHRYFTDQPRQFSYFITNSWAQPYYDTIYNKSITPTKVDWNERVEFLTDIRRAIKEGELTLDEARKYES